MGIKVIEVSNYNVLLSYKWKRVSCHLVLYGSCCLRKTRKSCQRRRPSASWLREEEAVHHVVPHISGAHLCSLSKKEAVLLC